MSNVTEVLASLTVGQEHKALDRCVCVMLAHEWVKLDIDQIGFEFGPKEMTYLIVVSYVQFKKM
jgi:hypothetical protein